MQQKLVRSIVPPPQCFCNVKHWENIFPDMEAIKLPTSLDFLYSIALSIRPNPCFSALALTLRLYTIRFPSNVQHARYEAPSEDSD